MSEHPVMSGAAPDILSETRTQRIRKFVVVLAVLNTAFVAVGLIDLRSSPLTLILALTAYVYYGIYYLLIRAGYGVQATYGAILLLLILVPIGIHNSGGFLVISSALYLLVLVSAGLILNEPRALDVIVTLCVISYGALIFFERFIAPPLALQSVYATASTFFIVALSVSMLVTMIGIWLVMRISIVGLHRSTTALEAARAEAERHSRENSALAAQVQDGNQSLLAAQVYLRETIEALSLPLIPLDRQVALLPLIGFFDDQRAERLVAGLLRGIQEQRASVVILDITGLRAVDARVATALLQAADAARLLGARVVLSGISPASAQMLVDLSADLTTLQTASRLSDALRMAAESVEQTL